jgi:hypothetical protein
MANTRNGMAILGGLVRACRGFTGRACILSGASPMRTWAHWTTTEIRKLKEVHEYRVPSFEELSVIFPRHSIEGIRQTAMAHKLRRKQRDWMKIAKQYSIERGDKALVRA